MKSLLISLVMCFGLVGLMGCEDTVYADPPANAAVGTIDFCDDYGCRDITAQYYYDASGALFYWDTHFGCWIGPHGYWRGGAFYHGYYPGYHGWYHSGFYHRGGFHGGYHGGFHGGYHGGGGFHGGGHGGHGGRR